MVTKLNVPFSDIITIHWNNLIQDRTDLFPFESPLWHSLWLKNFLHTPFEPYILSIEEKAIAPFIRNGNTVSFSGGKEISDYMDIICPESEICDVWPKILTFLKKDSIQTLTLSNIRENSKTYEYFISLQSSSPYKVTLEKEDTTPILSLPNTWDEYLTGLDRKSRHELKRKIKRFEETWGTEKISIQTTENITILLELMKKDSKKREFLTESMATFFHSLTISFPSEFELLLLSVSDIPAAVIAGFSYLDTYLLYNSGFDEAVFSGAGLYLKAKSINRAIEKKMKTYNFLQGNERYKYELGGKDFSVYTITVNILKY